MLGGALFLSWLVLGAMFMAEFRRLSGEASPKSFLLRAFQVPVEAIVGAVTLPIALARCGARELYRVSKAESANTQPPRI